MRVKMQIRLEVANIKEKRCRAIPVGKQPMPPRNSLK